MKYIIDTRKLEFGDIIMIQTYDSTCELIRRSSGSNYSHAMIYSGNDSCLESNALGVASVNPQRYAFKSGADAAVFRLKDEELKSKLVAGFEAAVSKIGMAYSSKFEVRKSLRQIDEPAAEPRRQYCTKYVAKVYSESGIPIVPNPDYCSPKNIQDSPELVKVEGMIRIGSKEEIELALEENHVVDEQTDSTFTILEEVRKLTGEDIQSFDDIDDYLLSNSNQDEGINNILKSSGYLESGDKENKENPFFYDLELFLNHFGEAQCIRISIDQLPKEKIRRINFSNAISKYGALYKKTGLEYFNSHAQCYLRQLELSNLRLEVFSNVLDKYFPSIY